ncbi:MAG: UDP-2,3-diacylglucosamine diphosphatase [Candidatus Arsenophonus melophagi]|nr:UDP-2,3-diacylglucosamine diphosphatase [Candidatus Arsenophonus melophagi]
MVILFIADLHLSEQEPAITVSFLHFLREQASKAKALYILGDFFDYWIGDDNPSLLYKSIAKELQELRSKGVTCYFIHGNRDFLLGKKFAKASGMTLLPTEKVLTLHGHHILILHGDTLCTNDVSFQRYRKKVHNPLLQRLFLALPLSTRHSIAKRMRKNSQAAIQLKPAYITDVNKQTVIEKFQKYQVDWMIHGHTHKPAIHDIHVNGKILHRAVLGAWDKNIAVIKITPTTIELLHIPVI